VASGVPMNIEDTWGGDIVTAAIAHLAHSTPPELLLCSTDFNSYGPAKIAGYNCRSFIRCCFYSYLFCKKLAKNVHAKNSETTAHRIGGKLCAPTAPGLGVEPIFSALGDPIIDVS